MTYTFQVGKSKKIITANSFQDAVDKIMDKHWVSYMERQIKFINSNDPKAPKERGLMYTTNIFNDWGRLTQDEEEEIKQTPKEKTFWETVQAFFTGKL